ncbi:uncharacterized protein [Glycine max]|uniref:uncharacterized protein n=1 Tax=Glycine max TaxID=3847 RepID=UPI001B35728B|nr:uncharacterized protein LOC102660367 [Glycine max]
MGFCERWGKWIHGCLSSATISILINGSTTREFVPERGLRQGDPLAPFLFNIAAKGLTGLMRTTVSKNLFSSYKVGRQKEEINILQYADDTLFFGTATTVNVRVMKSILRIFELVSGLKINYAKSQFGCLGKSLDWCREATSYLNCGQLEFPFSYLGIPVGSTSKSWDVWQHVISKFESKVAKWKQRCLSMGGRIFLTALPIYLLSFFKIPKKVVHKLPWADGGVPFKERFSELYQISSQRLHSVEDMGYFSEHGWEWNFSWRRNLFDSEMGVASTFLETIAAIRICGTLKDTWLWGAEPNGIFSTKSAYNLIKAEQLLEDQDSGFHQLWDLKVPPKVLSFAWRLLWDRLPTKDNLSRRQIQLDNDLCPLCQTQPETASYLFFTCDKVLPLWWEFFTWVKEGTILHNSPMANFLHTSTTTGGKNITRRRKTWWLAATKSIWQSRNDLVFHNQAFDIHKLIDNSIFLTWTWLKGWEKNFCAPFHHWSSAMSLVFV